MTESEYLSWKTSLADYVLSIQLHRQEVSAGARTKRTVRPGSEFVNKMEDFVSFQLIELSDHVTIVGISAEVVAEYAQFARDLVPSKFALLAGCTDNTFGYVPTAKMIDEGGYESVDFCSEFGLHSVAPDVETNLKTALMSLTSD